MGYHRYVFDDEARTFVGRFEEMYRGEQEQGFDSWHQEDARNLTRRLCLTLLDETNFAGILDVGCGKGAFTHRLKKRNNRVVGIDISPTALETAKGRFDDVEFVQADLVRDLDALNRLGNFDLVVCLETLSYLENWRDVIERFSQIAGHCLIALYLPENPIGFVKTAGDLAAEFARHFVTVEDIRLLTRNQIVLYGTARR